MSLEEPR